jgi:hypothetical protein
MQPITGLLVGLSVGLAVGLVLISLEVPVSIVWAVEATLGVAAVVVQSYLEGPL